MRKDEEPHLFLDFDILANSAIFGTALVMVLAALIKNHDAAVIQSALDSVMTDILSESQLIFELGISLGERDILLKGIAALVFVNSLGVVFSFSTDQVRQRYLSE